MKKNTNAFGIATNTSQVAETPPAKSQMIELRKLILDERGSAIVKKVIDLALDDESPVQSAALKMCMDRLLPMSEFEKGIGGSKPTITINIGGINEPVTIEGEKGE